MPIPPIRTRGGTSPCTTCWCTSSGLGHWSDYPAIGLTIRASPDEVVAAFQQSPPLFPPGDGWKYSSPGYALLAHVAERSADEPYREFLAGAVFGPAGLDRTFTGAPHGRDDLAIGYAAGVAVTSFELDTWHMGAGDVWSTAADLRAWLGTLRDGRLLSEESVRLLFTEHAATGQGGLDSRSYGYGWYVGELDGEP